MHREFPRANKAVKVIVLLVLLLLEGILSAELTKLALEEYAEGTLSSGLTAVVTFYGFAVVSFAEIIRVMKGKKRIFLPMLGMKAAFVSFGISEGLFADYRTTADRDALGGGITFSLMTIVLILAGYGMKYGALHGKRPRVQPVDLDPAPDPDRSDAEEDWEEVFEKREDTVYSGTLLLGSVSHGQLCQKDSDKDQETSQKLSGTESLMEQKPAG